VQLEIKEYFEAKIVECVDDARSVTCELLQAKFDPAELASEGLGEGHSFFLGVDVQGEDEAAVRGSHKGMLKA
jgi:hypothetical protein